MDKKLDEIIDKHLNEEIIDEAGYTDSEISSLSTGLKRIEYRLSKANTPQRFQDVFNMVSALVNEFLLKTKFIWKVVKDAYIARYGMSETFEEGMTRVVTRERGVREQ